MNIQELFEKMKTGMIYKSVDLPSLINEVGRQQLIQKVLDNAGNVCSLIRENMMGIHDRLVEEQHLTKDECIQLFNGSLENLFKGLGSKGDDTVFTRAFTSLYIAYIVIMDEDLELLTQDQYMLALDKAVEYMQREVDRRGFVMGKGWAHAPAHGADLLCALASSTKFPMEYAGKILECIKFHITSQDSFIHGEESRMAAIVPILLEKGYNSAALESWLEGMVRGIRHGIVPYSDESYPPSHVIFKVSYFAMAIYCVVDDGPYNGTLKPFLKQFMANIWALSE